MLFRCFIKVLYYLLVFLIIILILLLLHRIDTDLLFMKLFDIIQNSIHCLIFTILDSNSLHVIDLL